MKILIYLTLMVGLAMAQKGPQSLAEAELMIADIKKQIQVEETRWAEEKSRDAESEKKRQSRYQRFKAEKIALKKDLKTQDQRVRATLSKIASSEAHKLEWEQKMGALEQQLQKSSESYVLRVESSFPFEREKRLETAKLLVSDIRQDKTEPEAAFLRLDNAYQYELRLAQDASVKAQMLEVPTGDVEAKYARIGKQVMVYASSNGEYVGVLNKNPSGDYIWITQDSLHYDQRQSIRNAVAVAEGKALPGFVNIPVWRETYQGVESFDVQSEESTPQEDK